jgi:hypothetical protein
MPEEALVVFNVPLPLVANRTRFFWVMYRSRLSTSISESTGRQRFLLSVSVARSGASVGVLQNPMVVSCGLVAGCWLRCLECWGWKVQVDSIIRTFCGERIPRTTIT